MTLVTELASPTFQGRLPGTEGSQKARDYLVKKFQDAGLEPVPARGYRQRFAEGVNIMGWLPGWGPMADQVIVVGAHYDHLGTKDGALFPGANDNASGVAAMIAAVHALKEALPSPRRSLLVVAFDAEEQGLLGSKHFAKLPPVARRRLAAAIILDMVGTPAHSQWGDLLLVFGAEKSPELELLSNRIQSPDGLKVVRGGIHLMENTPFGSMTLSDYGPFRDAGIPFAMLTSGMNAVYHTPNDTPSAVSPSLLAGSATWLQRYLTTLLTHPSRPTFDRDRVDLISDVREIAELLHKALLPKSTFRGPNIRQSALESHLTRLNGIRRRLSRGGAILPDDALQAAHATFRLMCYCAGTAPPIAPMCNKF